MVAQAQAKKTCSKCCKRRPLSEFPNDKGKRDGKSPHCKRCRAEYDKIYSVANRNKKKIRQAAWARAKLLREYSLTADSYNQMLADQDGLCGNPACFNKPPIDRHFDVDHSHTCCPGKKSCGKFIRGILCNPCNRALGYVYDDINKLYGLIEYLERDRAHTT